MIGTQCFELQYNSHRFNREDSRGHGHRVLSSFPFEPRPRFIHLKSTSISSSLFLFTAILVHQESQSTLLPYRGVEFHMALDVANQACYHRPSKGAPSMMRICKHEGSNDSRTIQLDSQQIRPRIASDIRVLHAEAFDDVSIGTRYDARIGDLVGEYQYPGHFHST